MTTGSELDPRTAEYLEIIMDLAHTGTHSLDTYGFCVLCKGGRFRDAEFGYRVEHEARCPYARARLIAQQVAQVG